MARIAGIDLPKDKRIEIGLTYISWLLPLLPGSLATVFATVTYFILVFPCIAGGAYLIATTSCLLYTSRCV